MKLAYNYRALGSTGEVKGVVFASRKAFARATLRKMGLEPKAVTFAPIQTLSGSLSEEFDPAQLEQFYRYFARLESKGVARSSSLADAVSTTSDMRLRSALATMNEAITGKGMKVHQAMSMAGFPARDCSLVSAVEDKVTIDKVLLALADELKRIQDLRRSINKMLMMPKVMFFIGVILFYLNLVYAAPKIYTLFTTVMTQVELPEYARVYYEAASQFNKNAVIGTILYVAAVIGLVLLGRSGMLTRFINVLGPVRIARQKADYAALWGSFSLLYSVGEHREEIFRKLAKSATTKKLVSVLCEWHNWCEKVARLTRPSPLRAFRFTS
jgi:type II secretory pathway component PulF